MKGVDLSDQMKVSYQVDRRSKFHFYLIVFFDFLDISAVNSKIIYDKMDFTVSMSAMDFRFSLAHSMIGKFSNKKGAGPMYQPSKKSKGESFDTVGHLPEFSATRARCTLCSSKKIENCTFIRCLFFCNVPLCLQKERNCFYLHREYFMNLSLSHYIYIYTLYIFIYIYIYKLHFQHDNCDKIMESY